MDMEAEINSIRDKMGNNRDRDSRDSRDSVNMHIHIKKVENSLENAY
jgi:hypothetical protein